MEAYERGVPVIDVFAKNDIVRQYLSEEEIRESLNPGNYLGLSKSFVDKVLNNFVEMRD